MNAGTVRRPALLTLTAIAAAVAAAAAIVGWLSVRDPDGDALSTGPARRTEAIAARGALPAGPAGEAERVARGDYLVRAGSCVGCHTERGGVRFAGGRPIETPFGTVYAPNLTPDVATGLGSWTADDFWRALHHGRSRDGRFLYPAFPYPNYTRLARADADAMFAYLRSLAPVARRNEAHVLRFPFDQQAALAVWRALFFRPDRFIPEEDQSSQWNRGAYLVETLGHCNACHSRRNVFGATAGPLDLDGGLIPIQNWYAPSLHDSREAGVAEWPAAEIAALLRTGVSPRGIAQGPMAEVVAGSTQHLDDADLAAMVTYLQSLPPADVARSADSGLPTAADREAAAAGQPLYDRHCTTCHGDDGRGVPGAYPALAGSRAVAMTPASNLVHIVLRGGFAPVTAGNPRPYGMPPFATVLADAEVAAVLSYIRGAWGNRAGQVTALEVSRTRGSAR